MAADAVRLRTEQITGLWSLLPSYAASSTLCNAAIALMCWPVVAPSRIATWFGTTMALSALLVVAGRRLCAPERAAAVGPEQPLRVYLVLCTAFAAVQSAALWWVVPAELPYGSRTDSWPSPR
jgi:hypothetical protein